MLNFNMNRQTNMVPIAVLVAQKNAFDTKTADMVEENARLKDIVLKATEENVRLVKENESLRSSKENARIDAELEAQRMTNEKEVICSHNIHLSKLVEQHVAEANRLAKETEANNLRINKENTKLVADLKNITEQNTKLVAETKRLSKKLEALPATESNL